VDHLKVTKTEEKEVYDLVRRHQMAHPVDQREHRRSAEKSDNRKDDGVRFQRYQKGIEDPLILNVQRSNGMDSLAGICEGEEELEKQYKAVHHGKPYQDFLQVQSGGNDQKYGKGQSYLRSSK